MGFEDVVFKSLFEILGYKNNQNAFAELATQIQLDDFANYSESTALAILFGIAGLLPDPTRVKIHPSYRDWVQELWSIWWQHRKNHPDIKWNRSGVRPFNSPERRLLAGFMILSQNNFHLGSKILGVIQVKNNDANLTICEIKNLLAIDSTSKYNEFYNFVRPLKKPAALLGSDRINDLLVNLVIPSIFSQALLRNDLELCRLGKKILLNLPRLQDNRLFKEAIHYFFIPPSRGKRLIESACAQQGLLGLYREYFSNK